MYAVIETGGKQYRVEVGQELEIELLEAAPGDTVAFERILLIADGDAASIGRPVVENASVSAEILRRDRGEKLISFKYRPKARSRVKKGHRQELTVVRISDIVLDGKSAAKEYAAAEKERATERQKLQDAARKQAEQDAALAAKLTTDAAAAAAKAEADKPAKGEKAAKPKSTKAAKTDTTDTVAKKATGKTKATDAAKAPRSRKSDKD